MRPKILVSSFYDRKAVEPALKRLEKAADIVVCQEGRTLNRDELTNYISDVDAVIAAEERYTAAIFDRASKLKMITRDGVGLDNIDIDEATRRGIVVTNSPAVHDSVADLTIGLLIAVVRKLLVGDKGMRSGRWNIRDDYLSADVHDLTLGLLGFGLNGKTVAKRAAGFGMHVIAYDIRPNIEDAKRLGVELVNIDRLLAESDALSIHVSLNESTRGMVTEEFFKKMKRGAFLVNTSRGAVIDEKALYSALISGHLAGAGLDVMCPEPPAIDNPLLQLDNVVLTPHVGSDTRGTFLKVYQTAVEDIILFFENKCPLHVVNPAVMNHPNCSHLVHDS